MILRPKFIIHNSRLYGDKNETINHIVSEWSKQRRNIVGQDLTGWKVINWEFRKKLKFYHNVKWYTHRPKSKGMRHIKFSGFWNTNRSPHPGPKDRRSDHKTIEKPPSCGFCHPGWPQSENKTNQKEIKVLVPHREPKICWTCGWRWYQ